MGDMADGLQPGGGMGMGPRMGDDGYPILGDYEFGEWAPSFG